MADRCLLYYITDRSQFPGDEAARRRALIDRIAEAAQAGIDYVQLREKDLSTRQLECLAEEAAGIVRQAQQTREGGQRSTTRLLINSRTDIAMATGAHGVHLRSDDVSPAVVRSVWDGMAGQGSPPDARSPMIAVSCHAPADVYRSASDGADFAVFAPVFEKRDAPEARPTGLSALREACAAKIPVLALGGVTLENVASCLAAGAAGMAGIRLFQENRIVDVVRSLRGM